MRSLNAIAYLAVYVSCGLQVADIRRYAEVIGGVAGSEVYAGVDQRRLGL